MMLAASTGHEDVVRVLLDHRANVSLCDYVSLDTDWLIDGLTVSQRRRAMMPCVWQPFLDIRLL